MKYLFACIGGLLLFSLGMLVNRQSKPATTAATPQSSLITYMAQTRNGGQLFGEVVVTVPTITITGISELKSFILSGNTNIVTNSVIIINVLPLK